MSNPIREAIERTSAGIAADPAKARVKNAPATARLAQGLRFEVSGPNGEKVLTDMPAGMGGQASGANPGWLLRGALASCTATVIAMRAAKQGIALRTLEVTVESESDQRGLLGLDEKVSAGLSGMRMRVKIAGDAGEQALHDLVGWADRHSPVGCTLRDAVPSALEIEVA